MIKKTLKTYSLQQSYFKKRTKFCEGYSFEFYLSVKGEGSHDSVDAEELSEEHDELESFLQEKDSTKSTIEMQEVATELINQHIMVASIKGKLDK